MKNDLQNIRGIASEMQKLEYELGVNDQVQNFNRSELIQSQLDELNKGFMDGLKELSEKISK